MADRAPLSFAAFGDLLKYLRESARLTQEELGLAVGYSRAHIARLENNQRTPDPATVQARFLDALQLSDSAPLAMRLIELAHAAHDDSAAQPDRLRRRVPNNLPIPITSFIGRRNELDELRRLLPSTRLLTLTGAGGVGKSRLALQLALESLGDYHDGVWQVELAPLSDGAQVGHAVATVVGIQEEMNRPILETLAHYLREKQVLVVLDNCEHLLDACARLAEVLLQGSYEMRMLTTSREALAIGGELAWRVPSLHLPAAQSSLVDLAHCESAQLFVERAAFAHASFTLTAENAAAVQQICAQLDGIPLAIEMAAAQVAELSEYEIVAGLADGIDLLASGSRVALPRHRTLRATMDWSYNLLSETERILLARLSVFAGGWTVEAAQAICGDAPLTPQGCVPVLMQLARKSLVVATMHNHHTRYHLLETIRQYAAEKLSERGETNQMRERQLQIYLALVEETMDPSGKVRQEWLSRVEPEHNNLRAAFNWARERADTDEGEMMLRVAGGMRPYRLRYGHYEEGLAWLDEALARGTGAPAHARAKALLAHASILYEKADMTALPIFGAALTLFQESNDAIGSAWCLEKMAAMSVDGLQPLIVEQYATQALAIFRAVDCQAGIIRCLTELGYSALDTHQPEKARAYSNEALRIALQTEDLVGLSGTVWLSYRLDPQLGLERCDQAIALCRQLGDVQQLALYHHHAGDILLEHNDYERAASSLEECVSVLGQIGISQGDFDNQDYLARCHMWLGLIAQIQGDTQQAITQLAQVGELAQVIGQTMTTASAQFLWGMLMLHQRQLREAEEALCQSLRYMHKHNTAPPLVYNFRSICNLERVKGHWSRAARLMGVYDTLLPMCLWITPTERGVLFMETVERDLADPRAQLGDAVYEAEYAIGQKMTVDEAVAYALGEE